MRGLLVGTTAACLVLACSDGEPEATGSGSGIVYTGAGGFSGTGGAGSSSGGATGATGGGVGAAGPQALGPPYPVVFAHGFFGFEEFAGADFATYFYGVKERLYLDGEAVYTPAVDPFNSSAFRGAQLADRIEDILAETGHEKVILVGHSQGGLDARVVAHDRPDLVAAVVTVATPHRGSRVADIALGIVDDPVVGEVLDWVIDVVGAPLYDQVGDETDLATALHQFSTPGIAAFNAAYPNDPSILYASIAGRTDYQSSGGACAPDVSLPLISAYDDELDSVDALLALSEGIIDGGIGKNEPNDGLVRVDSARWGEFWGCVPADHLDEVGQLFGDSPGLGNDFDHLELYVELVRHLRALGY
jgi:triacylglycerol lipase